MELTRYASPLGTIFLAADNGALAGKILEVSLKDGGPECSWRDVRPIPQPEEWFENVWRNYKQLYQN